MISYTRINIAATQLTSPIPRRLLASSMLALALSASPLALADASYDGLVNEARAGNGAPLLSWLASHSRQLDGNQRADWLQVANWAGDDEQVVLVWEGWSPTMRQRIPERGQLAVARAYRNLQQWPQSLALWQQVLQRNPGQQDARAGWVMTLSDAGDKQQARQEAERFVLEDGGFLSHQAFLYVMQGHGNTWDELFALTRLQDLNSDLGSDSEHQTLEPLLQAKTALQVATPALTLGQKLAPSAVVLRNLELDQAAQLVRMAHTDSRGEQEQYWIAERALARYAHLLQDWQGLQSANAKVGTAATQEQLSLAADIRRARIDRLGAYLARHRYQALINEYQSLQQQDAPLPNYAKRWAGSAYLSNRQPAPAYRILSALFADTPLAQLPPEDAQELFFAALESEHLDEAGQIAKNIIIDTPYHRYYHGSPTPQPNDNWLSGQVLEGHYLQKINQLDNAQSHNQHLSDGGPGNQGLRINLAETLLARGLPREAERQLKVAEVLEPANLTLERQQAYVAQDLQEWQQFDLLVDDVASRSLDEPATKQLTRAHQVENMSEFRLGANKGLAADNPVSGAHDVNLYSALYGPRLYDHWRPFIGFDYAAGRFDEGKANLRMQALGVEYSRRDHWAELEVSNHNTRGEHQLGLRFSYWHDIDDHWRLGTDLARLARDTPLRAIGSGVTANQGSGFVRWYENERRQYQFNLGLSDYSDGNQRFTSALSGKERLLTRPYLTLDLLPALSISSNSQQDGAYYSPKRDIHFAPQLSLEHVLYRSYEQVWRQQLLLGAGYYWQQDYGGDLSTTAGYGQRYAVNSVLDGGLMLLWSKQPYDGQREYDLSLVFDVNYRF